MKHVETNVKYELTTLYNPLGDNDKRTFNCSKINDMETASIIIEVGTVCSGNMVKNKIVLKIPKEAAQVINDAWHSNELPRREAIVAHNLLGNQLAHCDLVIGDRIAGGVVNMRKVNSDDDKYFQIEKYEDEND